MVIHRNIENILNDDDYGIQGEFLVSLWVNKEGDWLSGTNKKNQYGLTKAGEKLAELWRKIPDNFEHVQLKEYIITEDKFYGIISIDIYGKKDALPVYNAVSQFEITFGMVIARKNPFLVEGSVFHIVNWFKAASLIEIRKEDQNFLWKKGYYEYKLNNLEQKNPIHSLIHELD